jgi:PAS domain S-box-containing protein
VSEGPAPPDHLRESLDAMLDGFAMFRSVRDGGEIVDFEWCYVNAAGAAPYRMSPAELVGARLRKTHPRVAGAGLFDAYRAVVDTGEPLATAHEAYVRDSPRTLDLRAWKTGDGFAVTWRDVTDRGHTVDALRASEDRFRTSVELLHEALSVFVAVRDDGGDIADFRWTYANAAASAITGYSASDLKGRLLLDVLPDHGPSGMLDVYKGVVETGEPYVEPSLWYEDVWGDGQRHRRAFDVRASKVHDGFVVVTREVTGEREREAELARQRAELEHSYAEALRINDETHRVAEADRQRLDAQMQQAQRLESLGQLAGGIAHDFNNLLAAILNYSSFVAEQVEEASRQPGGDHWAGVRADVEQIRRAADRAAALTRQLLAVGRREVVRPRVLDLNEVVGEIEHLIRRTVGERVELVTRLDRDLWTVSADSGQIEHVLLNLARNARDAMPDGGVLTIETANVPGIAAAGSQGVTPSRQVCLRVGDTGRGMDPAVRTRAFEPFFTTKPNGDGSGLGLSTVYGIVTQFGGEAEIRSEPGEGTTFVALFPATDDDVAAPRQPPVDSPPRSGRGTVLLVEDEDAMREAIRRMLVRNGYTVICATGGEEAIQAARRHSGGIDLLLTDVVMPNMLGKEVAEHVVRDRAGIKVLYMSGYAQPVLASEGTLDAGVDLIEKPFSEPLLLAKVREMLDAR